jgi:hypothetical protein
MSRKKRDIGSMRISRTFDLPGRFLANASSISSRRLDKDFWTGFENISGKSEREGERGGEQIDASSKF